MCNYSLKEKVGCLLFDVFRMLPALFTHKRWHKSKNRNEKILTDNYGVDCSTIGPWSNDIYACHVFPLIGLRLMKQAINQWPFEFANQNNCKSKPMVSFIIPHRGPERLPLLQKVISSILAQNIPVECIVVEQNASREVEQLPDGVRYVHLPHLENPDGWHKSMAYNVGVHHARADIVVCHDGDILAPSNYAEEIVKRINDEGYDVVHLHRFLFCLDELSTKQTLIMQGGIDLHRPPERVRQNWKGGTLAITKQAFFQIGGFDERFTGWSGEDREFYDRCLVLNGYRFGYLPFIHLWHPEQSSKAGGKRDSNLEFTDEIMSLSREQRIDELQKLQKLQNFKVNS